MTTFTHIVFYVKDLPKTLEFYQKAFDLKTRFLAETGNYAELETGQVTLAFVKEDAAGKHLPQGLYKNDPTKLPGGCEILFTADDVYKSVDKALQADATIVTDPEDKPWGQTIAYLRDPEGILIEISSKMS
jgi:catechol 2,3-dioxygenase-like lactoylglutathione lyase family enzyme